MQISFSAHGLYSTIIFSFSLFSKLYLSLFFCEFFDLLFLFWSWKFSYYNTSEFPYIERRVDNL